MAISDIVPDPDTLLGLEPEEVGGVILEYFNTHQQNEARLFNFVSHFREDRLGGYPHDRQTAISFALMEGVAWLLGQGLIAPRADQAGWYFITRRGEQLRTRDHVRAYRAAAIFPDALLHLVVVANAKAAFIRGEYDTAVFQSFREVEVAVRAAAGLTLADYGVDLMRKAFHESTGALSAADQPKPEREALAHLFAGAIGLYKNPHSHRNVALGAEEGLEMILLASHLLRIVDARRP